MSDIPRRFGRMFLVAGVLFAASLHTAASYAAHLCSLKELDELSAVMHAGSTGKKCQKALDSKKSVNQICAICNADYRNAQRVDKWIAQHPKCAKDAHVSKLHSAGHGYIKAFKELCQ